MTMKKVVRTSLVCLVALGLAACSSGQKATTSSSAKTSSTTSQSSSSQSSSSEISSSSKTSDAHQAYQSLLQELGQKEDYQTSQYAFYDINKDGIDELLIKNSPAITEVFALQNNQPVSIISSIVAPVGGARSSFSILTDGTIIQDSWYSARPEVTSVAYTLGNGTLKEVKKVTYDMTSQVKSAEALGLSGQELDANSLSWQDLTTSSTPSSNQAQPASTGMDINAIASGDFSSIAGTWKNGKGATLVFDQNGLVSDTITLERVQIKDGYLNGGTSVIGSMVGGEAWFAFPAGIPNLGPNQVSDISKDRMLKTQYNPPAEDYYYKVD